jgi:hypothetical protein
MLNEPVLSEACPACPELSRGKRSRRVEGMKHPAIARQILRGVYPRAKRRTQNDIVVPFQQSNLFLYSADLFADSTVL